MSQLVICDRIGLSAPSPVYPDYQTSSEPVGMSEKCHKRKSEPDPGSRPLPVMVLLESAIAFFSAEAKLETRLAGRHSTPPPA
jgi:hypothetical protein